MNVWVFNALIYSAFYELAHFHLEAIIVDNTVFRDPIVYDNNPQITIDKTRLPYEWGRVVPCKQPFLYKGIQT